MDSMLSSAVKELLRGPEDHPFPEGMPFANAVTLDDGTVRHPDANKLWAVLMQCYHSPFNIGLRPPQTVGVISVPNMRISAFPQLIVYVNEKIHAPKKKKKSPFPPKVRYEKWKCPHCGVFNTSKCCKKCGKPHKT